MHQPGGRRTVTIKGDITPASGIVSSNTTSKMADTESVTDVHHDNEDLEDPLQDLTNDQLSQLLENTLQDNEVLATETQMFEKYLGHVEPKQLPGSRQGTTPSESSQDLVRRIDRKRSKIHTSTSDKSFKLNAEQKCDIAQREIEKLKEELDKLREESEKVLDLYKAFIEDADLGFADIKKESYEFERDVIKNATSGKVVAERVLRYFEDKMRSRDSVIEKLRLKNSTFKVQKKKLLLQLKQKEELGEVLHEVDFNQLKIENQQYLEKIDERNQDLLRLKLMAANTLQVLSSYKKRLNALTMESERLKSDIGSRNCLLTRIDTETSVAEMERLHVENINKKLRQQLADFRVPGIMEYVGEKTHVYELQKKVKSWVRKVEIADMALQTHRKTWQQMKTSHAMASHLHMMEGH